MSLLWIKPEALAEKMAIPIPALGLSKGYAYLYAYLKACIVLCSAQVAFAEMAIEPLESIQDAAYAFLRAQHPTSGEPPEIMLRPLDPRLRLAQCPIPLEVFLPAAGKTVGSVAVGVRCSGPKTWTIYQSATVRIFGQVLVTSRFLFKGTVLAPSDMRLERRDVSILHGGYETVPERLVGMQLRRALGAGNVLSPRDVDDVPTVRRGEVVILFSRAGGVEVVSSGTALNDASKGERVRVRNDSSKRVIEGVVAERGRVEAMKQ